MARLSISSYTVAPMLIKKNSEGKACDTVVRHIEICTNGTRSGIRHPERDGNGPPVNLRLKVGEREYAIEHTLLQPREDRIRDSAAFRKINEFTRSKLRKLSLPSKGWMSEHPWNRVLNNWLVHVIQIVRGIGLARQCTAHCKARCW